MCFIPLKSAEVTLGKRSLGLYFHESFGIRDRIKNLKLSEDAMFFLHIRYKCEFHPCYTNTLSSMSGLWSLFGDSVLGNTERYYVTVMSKDQIEIIAWVLAE